MAATVNSNPPYDDRSLENQQQGDEQSMRGLRYESAVRSRWLLALRGTEDRLSVAAGEDARISRESGELLFRQVKKKEGGSWSFTDLSGFLQHALRNYVLDQSSRFEFFTNASISAKLRDRRGHLKADHDKIAELAGQHSSSFCQAVQLHQNHLQPDTRLLLDHLEGEVRRLVDHAFPGGGASDLLSSREVRSVVQRLLTAEFQLLPKVAVSWGDVDRVIQLDELLRTLPSRALGNGSLTPFEHHVRGHATLDDDELFTALESVGTGRNISRSSLDQRVTELVELWLESGPPPDYHLVVLLGPPGSGKTWTIMRLGAMLARDPRLQVLLATDHPRSDRFFIRNLAIQAAKPCVVMIDSLFPDWAGHIRLPVSSPLLCIATADSLVDELDLARLRKKRATRITVVQVPRGPDKAELKQLAAFRGVTLASRELRLGLTSDFRHAWHLLSGREPSQHLATLSSLAGRPAFLEFLAPIWLATSRRAPIPLRLLERFVGRALPEGVKRWVSTSSGGRIHSEDSQEAAALLRLAYGGAYHDRCCDLCSGLISSVDAADQGERAFARVLIRRLCSSPPLLDEVLDRCQETLLLAITREPQWALILSWLPTFAAVQNDTLMAAVIRQLATDPPTTLGLHLLWLEIYDVDKARDLAKEVIGSLDLSEDQAITLLEWVMRLQSEELRRDLGRLLISWFVDLSTLLQRALLAKRNILQDLATLASDYGRPDDRRALLTSIEHVLHVHLQAALDPKQNWLEAFLSLSDRVRMQKRFGVSLALSRAILADPHHHFPAEVAYNDCFADEQGLSHRTIVGVARRLLEEASRRTPKPVPGWPSSVVVFVARWGNDTDWNQAVSPVLGFLDGLHPTHVPVDRVSQLLLPLFGPLRRGPQQVAEGFLRTLLKWLPTQGTAASEKTGQFIMHVISYASAQAWLSPETRSLAHAVFIDLLDLEAAAPVCTTFFADLATELNLPTCTLHPTLGLPANWHSRGSLATTYLSHVGRLPLASDVKEQLLTSLAVIWGGDPLLLQALTHASLRLGGDGRQQATVLAQKQPDYPDSYAYLAISHARSGDPDMADEALRTLQDIWARKERGLHPYLAAWMYREIAGISGGRKRTLCLLCAELCRPRLLRHHEDVVKGPTED